MIHVVELTPFNIGPQHTKWPEGKQGGHFEGNLQFNWVTPNEWGRSGSKSLKSPKFGQVSTSFVKTHYLRYNFNIPIIAPKNARNP